MRWYLDTSVAFCSLLGAGVTLVSHDINMLTVATALGLDAEDPLIRQ